MSALTKQQKSYRRGLRKGNTVYDLNARKNSVKNYKGRKNNG